ncbi:MAG: hypothetical protein JWL69_1419 [Phycisphaerales bacterium]|nr:hypothetical protein [Phycisphaerales bacterium]MDB5357955.1 hypothetical protein [Phycisphaerales bacterium]
MSVISGTRPGDVRRLAESCRVVFDLNRLRANIQAGLDGETVSEADVHDWLEALGFTPALDGHAWIGRHRGLRHFAEGEVISIEGAS